MRLSTCQATIRALNREFGPANATNQFYRWAIRLTGSNLDYIIGLDGEETLPVTIWLFDPLERGEDMVQSITVHGPADVEHAVQEIRKRMIAGFQRHEQSRKH